MEWGAVGMDVISSLPPIQYVHAVECVRLEVLGCWSGVTSLTNLDLEKKQGSTQYCTGPSDIAGV